MTLRIIFMGTPEFSVPTLSAILAAGHAVPAVYSQPPRPAGRGMEERRSPVHRFAEAAGIEVRTPKSLRNPDAVTAFGAVKADLAVVVAYGLLLPRQILEATRLGCFNLHGSALPRWRGAAPIQRAIMAGDTETAVMVMRMEEGLDTGPVCLMERVAIGPDMTTGALHDELSARGGPLMVRALDALEHGRLPAIAQPEEGVTYARKIDKSEARIDFGKPAGEVHNLIRGLSPTPGAWFDGQLDGKTERIKVLRSQVVSRPGESTASAAPGTVLDDALEIACGSGSIRLVEVQRAGKRPMSTAEFLRGFPLAPGAWL